jgi:hypothetical protein
MIWVSTKFNAGLDLTFLKTEHFSFNATSARKLFSNADYATLSHTLMEIIEFDEII